MKTNMHSVKKEKFEQGDNIFIINKLHMKQCVGL